MKRVLTVLVCTLIWSNKAEAQTCVGTLNSPLQVGADAAFSSSTRNVTAGATRDMDKFFVRGGLALTSISGVSTGTGFVVEGGGKFDVTTSGNAKHFQVCPSVTFLKEFGIDPGDGTGISPSALSFGVSVGFDLKKINTTRVVPTVGFYINRVTEHFGGFLGSGAGSSSETSGLLQFGVGFIFNDKMSLVPSLFVPFSSDNSEVLFSVLFGYKIH